MVGFGRTYFPLVPDPSFLIFDRRRKGKKVDRKKEMETFEPILSVPWLFMIVMVVNDCFSFFFRHIIGNTNVMSVIRNTNSGLSYPREY